MFRFRRFFLAGSRPLIMGLVLFAGGYAAGVAFGPTLARSSVPESGGRPHAEQRLAGAGHPAELIRVNDGDTFEARVGIWPGMEVTTKVRLRGIDAPERRARCRREYSKAEAATLQLEDILRQGGIRISDIALDKYGGRVLASVATSGTANVSDALLAAGMVRPYDGGRRESWCG